MTDGRPCEACKRSTYINKKGKTKPLETCWSDRWNQYTCKRCHFKPTPEEKKR